MLFVNPTNDVVLPAIVADETVGYHNQGPELTSIHP